MRCLDARAVGRSESAAAAVARRCIEDRGARRRQGRSGGSVNRATTGSHPGGLTSAAVTRPQANPLPCRFSGDRVGRNQSTETCAALCRGRQRLDHASPAAGASRPFGFAHEVNLPPNRLAVHSTWNLAGRILTVAASQREIAAGYDLDVASSKWRDLDNGPRSLTQGGNHEPNRSSFSARTNRIDEVSA